MEAAPPPSPPTPRVGWITQILGALALLRLIPEAAYFNPTWGRDYFGLLGADVFLGLLAFGAGWAFRRTTKGTWEASCFFWGAGTALSLALTVWLLPGVLSDLWRHSFTRGDVADDSRFLIYVLTIAAAPYALWTLLRPEPQRPSRRSRWAWMLAGAALATADFFGLIYSP